MRGSTKSSDQGGPRRQVQLCPPKADHATCRCCQRFHLMLGARDKIASISSMAEVDCSKSWPAQASHVELAGLVVSKDAYCRAPPRVGAASLRGSVLTHLAEDVSAWGSSNPYIYDARNPNHLILSGVVSCEGSCHAAIPHVSGTTGRCVVPLYQWCFSHRPLTASAALLCSSTTLLPLSSSTACQPLLTAAPASGSSEKTLIPDSRLAVTKYESSSMSCTMRSSKRQMRW